LALLSGFNDCLEEQNVWRQTAPTYVLVVALISLTACGKETNVSQSSHLSSLAEAVRRDLSTGNYKGAATNLLKLTHAFRDRLDELFKDTRVVAQLLHDVDEQMEHIISPDPQGTLLRTSIHWLFQPILKLKQVITDILSQPSDFNILVAVAMLGDQGSLAAIFEKAALQAEAGKQWQYERISRLLYVACLSRTLKNEAGLPYEPTPAAFKKAAVWLRTHGCGVRIGTTVRRYEGALVPADMMVLFYR